MILYFLHNTAIRKQIVARTDTNINRRNLNGMMHTSSTIIDGKDESEIVFVRYLV
jgi:hypothetical protein